MALFRHLALLAVSAAAVAAQVIDDSPPPVPPKPILGCTTNSFAIPSWFVQNFTYQSSDDVTTFHLLNRANNFTADMGCANSTAATKSNDAALEGLWTRCWVLGNDTDDGSLLALIKVNDSSANMLISQGWQCNDRNSSQPIKFAATVNTSLTLDNGKSTNSDVLVKGSLQSPVKLTPAYAQGPIGHDKPGCAKAAKEPKWSLQSVYYLNQTGDDGKTSIASQTLMLQVINHDIGYQAGCVGFLPDDLSAKPTLFDCSGQGYDFIGKDRYRIQTRAMFEPATFRFTVHQTWYCDEDASKPMSVEASGSLVLPLNCTSVPIAASDNSAAATGNKTTCLSDGDIVIKGDGPGKETPLPPYSIEDPLPTPDGCTVSSIVSPAWTFSSVEVDGPWNRTGNLSVQTTTSSLASPTSVGFDVRFTTGTNEFTYPISVNQGSDVAGKPGWHTCTFGPGEIPLAPYNCTFAYDAASREITLAAEWICTDLDPKHPIQFTGVAKTKVTEPMRCSGYGSRFQCLTDDKAEWTAPIANVTWQAADSDILAW